MLVSLTFTSPYALLCLLCLQVIPSFCLSGHLRLYSKSRADSNFGLTESYELPLTVLNQTLSIDDSSHGTWSLLNWRLITLEEIVRLLKSDSGTVGWRQFMMIADNAVVRLQTRGGFGDGERESEDGSAALTANKYLDLTRMQMSVIHDKTVCFLNELRQFSSKQR